MAKSLQGQLEDGIADQNLALTLSARTPKIYFNRASLHFQARRFEQARADFLSELAINPE
jgi:tetratricopeptide (TPR) repeat protein